MKRAVHHTIDVCRHATVVWIEKFCHETILEWTVPIDLILIDGDHRDAAVESDWNDWSGFVKPGGVAILHDARGFEGGWTAPEWGPVRLVDRLLRDCGAPELVIAEGVHSLVVVERRA